MQRVRPCLRVACAHAALAGDAQVGVVAQEGVCVEHGLLGRVHLVGRLRHADVAAHGLQLAGAVLVTGEAVMRRVEVVARKHELKGAFAGCLHARGVGRHRHALSGGGVACGQEARLSGDLDHAHAARRRGAAALQEAQRGDIDARLLCSVEDGCAFGHLHCNAVDCELKHIGSFRRQACRSQSGRIAGTCCTPALPLRDSSAPRRLRSRACARVPDARRC